MHFWYIQATMPFMDKQFIVTCQGTELLKKHMQGFRKELYAKVLENAQVITTNSYYAKKILINNFPIEFIQLRKDKVYNSGESAIFK